MRRIPDIGRCVYCGRTFEADFLTRDHVIPRAALRRIAGMPSRNIVLACRQCNGEKSDKIQLPRFLSPWMTPAILAEWQACIDEIETSL